MNQELCKKKKLNGKTQQQISFRFNYFFLSPDSSLIYPDSRNLRNDSCRHLFFCRR